MNRRLILMVAALMMIAVARVAVAQKPLTPEERELVKAQIAKEKAAATYYQGQLELARKQAEATKPQQYTSALDKYTHKDPADLVESVAAILAVMLILIMFISTFRLAKRDQRDARFFEALKRFGDPGSPALRSTAAGILAQMGRQKAYSDTALDQLVSGLMLEESPVVQCSIANAIKGLAREDSQAVSARLGQMPPEMRERAKSILGP